MFLVLFTSQAADNQFLPDVLGIKAERWSETAADIWDKHCLGFFACIFYLVYVNISIQNHSLTTCDEEQWANQPSRTWKTKYLPHDFETRHQHMLWTSCYKVLWAVLFMLVLYEIPTVCTTKPPRSESSYQEKWDQSYDSSASATSSGHWMIWTWQILHAMTIFHF